MLIEPLKTDGSIYSLFILYLFSIYSTPLRLRCWELNESAGIQPMEC